MEGLTVDEREREKLRDILQGMAFGIDGVDREAAESLWDVSVRVEGGGSPRGLLMVCWGGPIMKRERLMTLA